MMWRDMVRCNVNTEQQQKTTIKDVKQRCDSKILLGLFIDIYNLKKSNNKTSNQTTREYNRWIKILLPKPETPPIFILQPINCPPHLCLHPILSHPVPSPIPHKSHLPSVRPACQAPTKFHPLKPYSTHAIRRKGSAESIKKYPEIRRRRSAAADTCIRKCVHITYKPPNILAQPSFWAFNIPPTAPSKSHVSSMWKGLQSG